jgi:hypothetical protein
MNCCFTCKKRFHSVCGFNDCAENHNNNYIRNNNMNEEIKKPIYYESVIHVRQYGEYNMYSRDAVNWSLNKSGE